MKITGILSVSNFVGLGYPAPFVATNLSELCDEVLVGIDPSFSTEVEAFNMKMKARAKCSNITAIESEWNRDNIVGGSEIAIQMDKLIKHASDSDWVVVLQADEFLHESNFEMLKSFMSRKDEVDGFVMERLYFWENLTTIRADWNAPMVRVFRPGTYSFVAPGATGDGMTTGKLGRGEELTLPYKIYHYSRIGDPKDISKRIRNLDTFFHPEESLLPVEEVEEYDFQVREFDNYSKVDSPKEVDGKFITYHGSHPYLAERAYLDPR